MGTVVSTRVLFFFFFFFFFFFWCWQRAVRTHLLSQHQKTQDRNALCLETSVFGPSPSFWTARVFQPWFSPPHLSFPLILRGRAISSWFTSTKSKVSGASFSCCAFFQ